MLPTPYSGSEPYIFISYSHKDSPEIIPIIGQMQSLGFRVWYDEGIDPGSEYARNIAENLAGCSYFIAFLSANFLGSEFCLDELDFAKDEKKPRLLIYLQELTLPPELRLRHGRIQAIHKYRLDDEAFYQKVAGAEKITMCREAVLPPKVSAPPSNIENPRSRPVNTPEPEPEPAEDFQAVYISDQWGKQSLSGTVTLSSHELDSIENGELRMDGRYEFHSADEKHNILLVFHKDSTIFYIEDNLLTVCQYKFTKDNMILISVPGKGKKKFILKKNVLLEIYKQQLINRLLYNLEDIRSGMESYYCYNFAKS